MMLPLLRRRADSELTLLLVLLAPGGSSVNAACTSNCRAVTVDADSLPLALLLLVLPLLKPGTVLTDSMGVT
jgi:hypothetical protein